MTPGIIEALTSRPLPESPVHIHMPGRSLSDRIKKLAQSKSQDRRLHEAAKAYQDRKAGGHLVSFEGVSTKFGVKRSTLQRRVEGKTRTMLQFNKTKQHLTDSKEGVLKEFILKSASRGFPLRPSEILNYANFLRQAHLGSDCPRVSDSWVQRYLTCHRDALQTHWSKPLDTQRAQGLNPAALKS